MEKKYKLLDTKIVKLVRTQTVTPNDEQQTARNKWHPYALTVSVEIQPLSTGDKSLKVRQEYNMNVGTTSLAKCSITA